MRPRIAASTIVAALAAFLLTASLAAGGGSKLITQNSIGKGKLGQTRAAYKARYGAPLNVERIDPDYTRINYPGKVSVYFKGSSKLGRYIVVAGKSFKTAKGIGPCSKGSAVKKAYPSAVKVSLAGGPEFAYRLGSKLWFDIEFGKVAAVALGKGTMTGFIASNAIPCGS